MRKVASVAVLFSIVFLLESVDSRGQSSNAGNLLSNSVVGRSRGGKIDASAIATNTPIKYLVVMFQENQTFDHYFGTYPYAVNPTGEPAFTALPDTPVINGLCNQWTDLGACQSTSTLLQHNPNGFNSATPDVQPFRLDRSEAYTCDNDNHYKDEQEAYDGGLLDKFAQILSGTAPAPPLTSCMPNLSMGYYDGNTVTALWNYAQYYAMSDNNFATTFGTTVMGHLNLLAGQTSYASSNGSSAANVSGKIANGSIIANVDPILDDCSTGTVITVGYTGHPVTNIGDLLSAQSVTWGWFYGEWPGQTTTAKNCSTVASANYNPHYVPFQYFASTANPHHLQATSVSMIGQTDQANHQYSLTDFWNAVNNGNMPAVTFLKAYYAGTGHPNDTTPLAEQTYLVNTINQLEKSPYWPEMAIIITYDDSDGWYDHVMPPIVNQSSDSANDALLGSTGLCGTTPSGSPSDRCGYGPRIPFLVVSPFAKQNFVNHSLTDQTSIANFIEYNWGLGKLGNGSFDAFSGSILSMFDFEETAPRRILSPTTGEVCENIVCP